MRKEVIMTLFNENTGEELTNIGSVSVKRGRVRIRFQRDRYNIRIYWEQDGTERWLISGNAETDGRNADY